MDKNEWGWQKIVDDLEAQLRYLDPNYTVAQVKEKFGTLRYYYDSTHPYGSVPQKIMDNCVSQAEWLSGVTCESCGVSGHSKKVGDKYIPLNIETKATHYWVQTLCAECRERIRIKREA
jgi:hypothetical protein